MFGPERPSSVEGATSPPPNRVWNWARSPPECCPFLSPQTRAFQSCPLDAFRSEGSRATRCH